jgi:hypothetical protein
MHMDGQHVVVSCYICLSLVTPPVLLALRRVCQCAANAPRPTHAHARASRRQLLARRSNWCSTSSSSLGFCLRELGGVRVLCK